MHHPSFAVVPTLFLLTLPASLPAADAREEKAAKEALAKVTGTWKIESETIDGAKTPPEALQDLALQFKQDGRFVLSKNGEAVWVGRFIIDSAPSPKRIDVLPDQDGADLPPTQRGIYKFDSDRLIVCLSGRVDTDAYPKEFASGPRSGYTLWVLRRANR
jgi:uncharacterized protein (TIGR03067 family)